MLPPLYVEDGDEYGAARYVAGERYVDTADRGQERYGGGVGAGAVDVYGVPVQAYGDDGEQYGIGTVLLGDYDGSVDDRYWTLLDADGPLAYSDWASDYLDHLRDGLFPNQFGVYPVQSRYGVEEFGIYFSEGEWSDQTDWFYN